MQRLRTQHGPSQFIAVLAVAIALVASACGDAADPDDTELLVVTTTTILGDVAVNLLGNDGRVEVLPPLGADPHDFRPSSQQAALIQQADLVLANGLGLEEGLEDVLAAAESDGANVFEVAPRLDPLPFSAIAATADDRGLDPHVWLDPIRMAEASRLVALELAAVAPDVDWQARAAAYGDELTAAHQQAASALAAIPVERRKLVSNHDSLGYLADRYDFEVVGVVISGGATLAAPSSAEMAALVTTIREENVPAIFAETTDPGRLAEAIAAEIGADVMVVELFTGSLGEPGSGADTLVGMLITNARRIAKALS